MPGVRSRWHLPVKLAAGACRATGQQAPEYALQLTGWVDTQFIAQPAAQIMVGTDSFRLASASGQRHHEQGPDSFPQRVPDRQIPQFGDNVRMTANGQIRLL